MDEWLTVEAVAAVLGVIPRRVRALIAAGELRGRKIGMQWFVHDSALRRWEHTRQRHPGRPLSQRAAWTAIARLEQTAPATIAELDERRRSVYTRARHLDLYVHPGVLDRLRDHPLGVLSGRDAAAQVGAPVDPLDVDVYAHRSDGPGLLDELRARDTDDQANAHIHLVDDEAWPFPPGTRTAPPWVAWLDLEDRQDRAATTLLDRLLGGRPRA